MDLVNNNFHCKTTIYIGNYYLPLLLWIEFELRRSPLLVVYPNFLGR
jgi:hypothetical protein